MDAVTRSITEAAKDDPAVANKIPAIRPMVKYLSFKGLQSFQILVYSIIPNIDMQVSDFYRRDANCLLYIPQW